MTTDISLNLSPGVLICRDGKASWPPSIELSCTSFTLCKSYSRWQATRGKGPGAYEGQKVAVRQVSFRGCPTDLPLYRWGHSHQRGRWVTQYHWQLLRSQQNEQKATSSQDFKGWQRVSPPPVPLRLSAEEALGTAAGMGRTAKLSYSEFTYSSQTRNLSAMLRVWQSLLSQCYTHKLLLRHMKGHTQGLMAREWQTQGRNWVFRLLAWIFFFFFIPHTPALSSWGHLTLSSKVGTEGCERKWHALMLKLIACRWKC